MSRHEFLKKIADLMKELAKEEKASFKASEARRKLNPGSSRARVTTANARWASAAEARDRTLKALNDLGVKIPQNH